MKEDGRSHQGFRRYAWTLLSTALLGVVFWFVGRALYGGIRQIDWATVEIRGVWLVLSVVLAISAMVIASAVLRAIYSRLGHRLRLSRAVGLFAIPKLGKYVPGKVMSVVGHVGMARAFGVPLAVSGSAVGILMGLSLASMTALGLLLVLLQPVQASSADQLHLSISGGVLLLLIVCLHPSIYFRLVNWGLRMIKRPPIQADLSLATMGKLFAGMALDPVCYAAGFGAMVLGLIDTPPSALPTLAGAFCLANVAGFLAFFAPAGVGVREGILMVMIGQVLPAPQAALVVVAARIWQTAMDLLTAGVGMILLRCCDNAAKKGHTDGSLLRT